VIFKAKAPPAKLPLLCPELFRISNRPPTVRYFALKGIQ
jgi:hypothetical protein